MGPHTIQHTYTKTFTGAKPGSKFPDCHKDAPGCDSRWGIVNMINLNSKSGGGGDVFWSLKKVIILRTSIVEQSFSKCQAVSVVSPRSLQDEESDLPINTWWYLRWLCPVMKCTIMLRLARVRLNRNLAILGPGHGRTSLVWQQVGSACHRFSQVLLALALIWDLMKYSARGTLYVNLEKVN